MAANCFQPSEIETGMTKPMYETNSELNECYTGCSAVGRIDQPEDIAAVKAFWVSEDARLIVGQRIMVDGGVMVHS
jgi:NAD(P)-dependent dehydrogenase (short-subunit alcohol dehydrogenase family)